MPDDVRVEYMALGELMDRQHPSNPKDHSIDSIVRSIERFGYVTPGTIDERTGYFAEGHGRTKALAWMKQQGREPPARIEKRANDWYVPVYRGVSFNSDSELAAFLVAANRLTILGGWNEPELAALLQDLAAQDTALLEVTGYDSDDLDAMIRMLAVPTLDALGDEYGEHDSDTFNPVIKVQVSSETFELYESLMASAPGTTDADKFAALLSTVNVAALPAS